MQIATATGSTGDPERVGYWQADTPDTADHRYTVWQADGVAIPPTGGAVPSGYGEWVQGNTGDKWDVDWSSISWHPVDCNLEHRATFSTENAPWEWNASPGNGTLRLDDPNHVYFPSGNDSGWFDDIAINTPIRVIAHLTAAFDQVPANAAKRRDYRVLITGLIRSIQHEMMPTGAGSTTINFSEPHVVYGRVNPLATSMPANDQVVGRMNRIHMISDDPNSQLMRSPDSLDIYGDHQNLLLQADDVASDLWTEMCLAANSGAYTTALRLYRTAAVAGSEATYPQGDPRICALPPAYPPTSTDPYQPNITQGFYGLDTRILSPDCSPSNATFNYTYRMAGVGDPQPFGDPNRRHHLTLSDRVHRVRT